MHITQIRQFALLLIGIAFGLSAFAHTSFPQDVTCPVDGKKFQMYVSGSYTTFGSKRDFEKTGALGNHYANLVGSCPKCHFSGYVDDFDTTYSKATKTVMLGILKPFKDAKMDDILEIEIAALIHSHFKRSNDDLANLYLVGSWLLRGDETRVEKRKEMQRNCLKYLELGLTANEYESGELQATVHYLIAEMYRRTGDFDKAIEHYDIAIANAEKADWLEDIANAQRELATKKDEDNSI